MKKLLTMIIVSTAAIMSSCANSVNVEKVEEYQIQPFTSIKVEGVGNIIYTQGNDYSVRAEGDSVLLARTIISSEDGCLTIDQKKMKNNKGDVNFYISSPTLTKVESYGVGSFEAKEAVSFDNDFVYESDGVGSVRISDMTCQNFNFHQEGVGASSITIKCNKASVKTEGVGACELEINADSLIISSDGVGAVKVKGHVNHYDRRGGGITSRISDKNLKVGE